MEIPLRRKYLSLVKPKRVRAKGDGDGRLGKGKVHHKVSGKDRDKLAQQPLVVLVYDAGRGRGRLVRMPGRKQGEAR